jgi:hypothetical protein
MSPVDTKIALEIVEIVVAPPKDGFPRTQLRRPCRCGANQMLSHVTGSVILLHTALQNTGRALIRNHPQKPPASENEELSRVTVPHSQKTQRQHDHCKEAGDQLNPLNPVPLDPVVPFKQFGPPKLAVIAHRVSVPCEPVHSASTGASAIGIGMHEEKPMSAQMSDVAGVLLGLHAGVIMLIIAWTTYAM